jgi:zinc protease
MVQIVYSGETPYNEKEALALEALGEVATIKVIEKLREDERYLRWWSKRRNV